MRIWIILFAARQEPALMEKPQGRIAGPALPRGDKSRSSKPRCPQGLSPSGDGLPSPPCTLPPNQEA
jgi:hypothetical protein